MSLLDMERVDEFCLLKGAKPKASQQKKSIGRVLSFNKEDGNHEHPDSDGSQDDAHHGLPADCGITITPKSSNTSASRVIHLQAKTQSERDDWLLAIQGAIKAAKQASEKDISTV